MAVYLSSLRCAQPTGQKDTLFFLSISAKDLKNMLSQVNYRVPNMRFLRERLTVMDTWGYLLVGQGKPAAPHKGPDWQFCSVPCRT